MNEKECPECGGVWYKVGWIEKFDIMKCSFCQRLFYCQFDINENLIDWAVKGGK